MPKRARQLRPAPVLPPPQAPGADYSAVPLTGPRTFPGELPQFAPGGPPSWPVSPTYDPHDYQQYPQYQHYAPQTSDQRYPMETLPR